MESLVGTYAFIDVIDWALSNLRLRFFAQSAGCFGLTEMKG